MTAIHELCLTEAAKLIAAREISSRDLTAACLARIEAREGDVGAWEYLDPELAMKQAKERDAAPSRGLLHGVPVGIKDIIDTIDMPTALGSPIYRARRPTWDAACVALLRKTGAVVLGKTVSTEFAYFRPGKTANPHNPNHTPGGSSSGSAAAVADYMVPFALGTQTAASVIRPAAFCGVIGYKGSYGIYPLAGIKSLSPSLDTLGAFTRSAEDLHLVRAALLGLRPAAILGPEDSTPHKLLGLMLETDQLHGNKSPRIGLCRTYEWHHADSNGQQTLLTTACQLSESGAHVVDLTLPAEFAGLVAAHKSIMAFEAARSFAYEDHCHRDQLSTSFRDLLDSGNACSWEEYQRAAALGAKCRQQLAHLLSEFDALLAPSAVGEAPLGLDATGDPVFSRMWNLLHVPTITVPAFKGSNGLPIGVQLIGPMNQDNHLIDLAYWVTEIIGGRSELAIADVQQA